MSFGCLIEIRVACCMLHAAVFFAWFAVVGAVKICLLNTRERLVRLTTAPHMHSSQSGACTPSLPRRTSSAPLAVSGYARLVASPSQAAFVLHAANCRLQRHGSRRNCR